MSRRARAIKKRRDRRKEKQTGYRRAGKQMGKRVGHGGAGSRGAHRLSSAFKSGNRERGNGIAPPGYGDTSPLTHCLGDHL